MNNPESVSKEIISIVNLWVPLLEKLPEETISLRKNSQNRSIKQIVGHIIDSASNNTHRMVHLQYQPSPLEFPNYASDGNNDRWIAIQDYQNEEWNVLIQLYKYSLLHVSHVMRNVRADKLNNEWIAGLGRKIKLEEMIVDFTRHLNLHMDEIKELIGTK
jgi:hypothetical protein